VRNPDEGNPAAAIVWMLVALVCFVAVACAKLSGGAADPTTTTTSPCPADATRADATCEAVAPNLYEYTFNDGGKAWCRDGGARAWCTQPAPPTAALGSGSAK
jgi:hypothetical protein